MAGLLKGFLKRMRQTCLWEKYNGEDDAGNPVWDVAVEIPCIFKPSKQIADGVAGGVLITPSQFYVGIENHVSERDKIIFRERVYIVESVDDLDNFGAVREGFKCSCRQEGGVVV